MRAMVTVPLRGSSSSQILPLAFAECLNCSLVTSLHCNSIMGRENKTVWLWTKSKEVMTASVERGWNTFIFTPETGGLSKEWSSMANIKPLFLNNGQLCDNNNEQMALFGEISCAEDLQGLEELCGKTDVVIMDAQEWQIMNSENMIASFQNSETSIFATAKTASEAQIFLESLEKGTDGIVLQTDDPSEVFELKAYLSSHVQEKVTLLPAIVQRVELIGMGDRVCVDLCSLLSPGEGLLVGSFARGLFLVHSECLKSNYVASRPFRINAGPVHAYVAMPGGKTSYLAELQSGMQVLVVNAHGRQRPATIGRVKIETRPLILVEAMVQNDHSTIHSLLLQNAETVNLVQPPSTGIEIESDLAVSVTNLKVGDKVLLSVQASARHTGIKIKEFIVEK